MGDNEAVILDCGTCLCRAGFSSDTENSPRIVIPNIIGISKSKNLSLTEERYIGDSALTNRKELNIRFPIEHGHITNWDDMQLMWQAIIRDKLRVKASNHPFLLTQICNSSRYNLEKIAEIFFENFDVPSLCIMPTGVASLQASGIDTGIAVEIGGGACFCVPVHHGYGLRHLQQRTEFSGRDLTWTLSKMISKKSGLKMDALFYFDIIDSIKEKYCYCAKHYKQECKLFSKEREFVHYFTDMNGDSKSVTIGMEQFQCPESLFQPRLSEKEFPGLHEIVLKCFKVEDDTLMNELASNIVLCGGSSFLPGLASRLQNELESMTSTEECSKKINVSVTPFQHAAFQGGVVTANCADFSQMSMSKEFYDENGPFEIAKLFR